MAFKTKRQQVVIPWRGFRCFTHQLETLARLRAQADVVIPWRGFRCFTLRVDAAQTVDERDLVL